MTDRTYTVAIVGGGISGLYCALRLAESTQPLRLDGQDVPPGQVAIEVLEASTNVGGRIESWTLDYQPGRKSVLTTSPDAQDWQDETHDFFVAEFGPMRIEPAMQPNLNWLLGQLGIEEWKGGQEAPTDLVPFPDYRAPNVEDAGPALTGEEGEQKSLLDLLALAILRICELVAEEDTPEPQALHCDKNDNAKRYWTQFLSSSSVRRKFWKGELQDWLLTLSDLDYDHIRKEVQVGGRYLHDWGFWNLLAEVLSHDAVIRIRDWATYYHLIPQNPNAAEHLVFWLRTQKTSSHLRGIRGGIGLVPQRLEQRLRSKVTFKDETSVTAIARSESGRVRVTLSGKFAPEDPANSPEYDEVILALPRRPLTHILGLRDIPDMKERLDSVIELPLLKLFFIVDHPWWNDDRLPNEGAGDLPTRELHYWTSRHKRKGAVMLYMDAPALQFWAAYLPEKYKRRQTEAWTWQSPDPEGQARDTDRANDADAERLIARLAQYVRESPFGTRDFTGSQVLAIGLRDWGREPFGAAVHLWKPGAKSWEVATQLQAFPIDPKGLGPANVHIVGDAYSDYQGFIEGALRSSNLALRTMGVDQPTPADLSGAT